MFSESKKIYEMKESFQYIYAFACKAVYERVINVVTSAHGMRSESYYVELHFLETLNRKIF